MPKDFPLPSDNVSRLIGREVLAHVASALLYPLGLRRRAKRTVRRKDQRTVVLIHGYLGNSSSLLPVQAYLRLLGVKNVLAFSYHASTGVERAARELRDFLRRHVRGGRIDFVCHSMGGVIANVYIHCLGGARRVDRCIMLGTPNQGTYSAYWLPIAIGQSLRPDSPLFTKLATARNTPCRVKFTSLVAGSDHIIIPRINAAAGDDIVYLENIGHLGILYSPTALRTVGQRLTSAA